MKTINIAKDFSLFPFGRYKYQSGCSGEVFRDSMLIPALKKHSHIIIELDGTKMLGSSFLEEVFGGLVRKTKQSAESLINRIQFVSEEKALIDRIQQYMRDAEIQ